MKTKGILLITFLALAFGNARSQGVCTGQPINMQLQDGVYTARADAFLANKFAELNKHLSGTQHPFTVGTFPTKVFFSMLAKITSQGSGMRIYFGASTPKAGNDNSGYAENVLVPIFVPTYKDVATNRNVDIKPFYILDAAKLTYKTILEPTKVALCNNFTSTIKPDLDKTLPATTTQGESTSLWYDNRDLKDWMWEIICQQGQNALNEITISWGAFEKDYYFRQHTTGTFNYLHVKGQLTLAFKIPGATVNFINNKSKDFLKFLKASALKNKNKKNSPLSPPPPPPPSDEFDTGVPCPPGDNCSGG